MAELAWMHQMEPEQIARFHAQHGGGGGGGGPFEHAMPPSSFTDSPHGAASYQLPPQSSSRESADGASFGSRVSFGGESGGSYGGHGGASASAGDGGGGAGQPHHHHHAQHAAASSPHGGGGGGHAMMMGGELDSPERRLNAMLQQARAAVSPPTPVQRETSVQAIGVKKRG